MSFFSSTIKQNYMYKICIIGISILVVTGCSQHKTISLISVKYKDNINVESYKPIATVTVSIPKQMFSDGFSEVTLQADYDLEKLVATKKMAMLHIEVVSCESETSIYTAPAFVKIPKDVLSTYVALLPYDFDNEVLQNENRIRGGTVSSTRAEFITEGGCAKLRAAKMSGSNLSTNKVQIFTFNASNEDLIWSDEK